MLKIFSKFSSFLRICKENLVLKEILIVAFSLLASASSVLALGQCMQQFVDSLFSQSAANAQLRNNMILLASIIVVISVSGASRYAFVNILGEKIAMSARKKLHSHFLAMEMSSVYAMKPGEVYHMLISDTEAMKNIIITNLSSAARNVIIFVGSIIMIMKSSPRMFLFTLLILLIVSLPMRFVMKRLKSYRKKIEEAEGKINALASESISNIALTKSLCAEHYINAKFLSLLNGYIGTRMKAITIRGAMSCVMMFMLFSSMMGLIFLGAEEINAGRMTAGSLSSFIILVVLCSSSATSISDLAPTLTKILDIYKKIKCFLSDTRVEYDLCSKDGFRAIEKIEGIKELALRDVSLSYEEKLVLNGINLSLKPGITALIGESGSGKSSLGRILNKLTVPSSGCLYIDEKKYEDILTSALRSAVCYMPQDPYIFNDTIENNITYGIESVTAEEVNEVSVAVGIDDFTSLLPHKLKTLVGGQGIQLSGGQKQRIGLARALLRNCDVLILDEATSAIDIVNEDKIYKNIIPRLKCKILLIIAHRASSIMCAGRVVIMDKGMIVAEGKHEDLKSNYYYNKMIKKEMEKNTEGNDI